MYVPFLSTPSAERRSLWRRKGGGGGGKGGGGSSGGAKGGTGGKGNGGGTVGGSSSSGSGGIGGSSGPGATGSGSGSASGRGYIINSGGSLKGASTSSAGTKSVSAIPAGEPFAGRNIGGATRGEVYGSKSYGSGYPGASGRGTAGRGFPFFFWPISFGAGGLGAGAYLHHAEYGRADNTTRPGGAQITAAFVSKSSYSTFRILSDNSTVTSLIQSVVDKCVSSLGTTNVIPSAYRGSNVSLPKPEQVIQYYRASSVALSLDGYNNTGAFSEDENSPDSPLPTNIDTSLMACMNSTIGSEVPLVDYGSANNDAPSLSSSPRTGTNIGLVSVLYVVWSISTIFRGL